LDYTEKGTLGIKKPGCARKGPSRIGACLLILVLLLPGAPSPVFHLRRKGQCRSGAASYEKRWVPAAGGRRWRLQCPGRLVRHLDGNECSEDPFCPGGNAVHHTFICHVFTRSPDGSVCPMPGLGGEDCLRCKDVVERGEMTLGEPPSGALL